MAIKIADAYIDILVDKDKINAQIAEIEASAASRIGQSVSGAVSAASGGGGGGSSFSLSMPSISSGPTPSREPSGPSGLFSLWDFTSQIKPPSSPFGGFKGAMQDARDRIGEILGMASHNVTEAIKAAGDGKGNPLDIGKDLMFGGAKGIDDNSDLMSDAMRRAIDRAIKAGQDEAEIRSPSARAARELGSPIMRGVELEVLAGGQNVANAMVNSVNYAISQSAAELFGGSFIGRGVTRVNNSTASGPLSGFDGLGNYLDQFGNQVRGSFAVGDPQNFGQASRILASNFPTKARDFGQSLLSGAVGSILPGFAAGPVSDMLGTMLGTKPILTAEQALGASMSADAGGLSDSPFAGGQFVFNNNFNGAGNFTQTERDVQLGILQSMRRLGVGF